MQSPRYILGSLLRQLLHQSRLFLKEKQKTAIKNLYKTYGKLRPCVPDSTTFLLILQYISENFKDVYIIIDGLDECTPREDLLSSLSRITCPHLHVFISSRPEKDVGIAFEGKPQIRMDDESVKKDIALHIDRRLEHDDKLKWMATKFKDELRADLLKMGGIMCYIFPPLADID